MVCNGCGNEEAHKVRIRYDQGQEKDRNKERTKIETCDRCEDFTVHTYDAYFREPSFEENLADSKHPQGQWVTSKGHKARLMREQGVKESGDRQHGARI